MPSRRHTWYDLELRTVTPMLSGRGATSGDGFRVTELRGGLQAWFRMLVGISYLGAPHDLLAMQRMYFGRPADEDSRDPQSSVMLRPTSLPATVSGEQLGAIGFLGMANLAGQGDRGHRDEVQKRLDGHLAYLAGPGRYRAGRDYRPARGARQERLFEPPRFGAPVIPANSTIGLQAAFRDDKTRRVFAACLAALAAGGGVGGRTRRAFGGVTVTDAALKELDADLPADDVDGGPDARLRQLAGYLRGLLGCPAEPAHVHLLTPFPVIANGVWALRCLGWQATLEEALADLGKRLRNARAPVPRVNVGLPPKRWAPTVTADYVPIVAPALRPHPPAGPSPIHGAALGLPLPYTSTGPGGQALRGVVESATHDRRASPLWLRILPSPQGGFDLFAHVFYAQFLPSCPPWPLQLTHAGGPVACLTLSADDYLKELKRVFLAL